jgi:hypothetical protein
MISFDYDTRPKYRDIMSSAERMPSSSPWSFRVVRRANSQEMALKLVVPRDELLCLDAEIARLGRQAGALRLRLGEALDRLQQSGGHYELLFSSVGAYVAERCHESPRFGDDSRALARRLAGLPHLRAALVAGAISWSMAELLARHATPENERDLLEAAQGWTVRAMQARLGAATGAADAEEEEPLPTRTLQRSLPAEDLWFWEATLLLIDHVGGHRMTLAEKVEALLAEGWGRLRDLGEPVQELLGRDEERLERARAWREQVAAWKAEAEEGCEARLRVLAEPKAEGPAEEPLPTTPEALDARIRELVRALHERDLDLGELALRLFGADGWRRLGFASETQYARERAGMSLSSLKGRMTLSRRIAGLPALREAVAKGDLGYAAAHLVARAARTESAQAWVERARERTFKHLREEVAAVELVARVEGEGVLRLGPPDDDVLEEVFELERQVRPGGRPPRHVTLTWTTT